MDALRAGLARLLGSEPESLAPVEGGDIGVSFRAELGAGRACFVKHYPGEPGLPAAEAHGLAWLAEAGALRLPAVLAASPEGESPPLLVLEWVESAPPAPGADEALGRGLAALHRSGAAGFGLDRDNFIGSLPQHNRMHATWAEFYAAERLAPLLADAGRRGLLGSRALADGERLCARLAERVGPPEPPARLHGDLWGGNRMSGPGGEPWLVDPAAYGGHREVDLAMMRLFGGFSERVFAAYEEAWPLAPSASERVELYQLYPRLVHLLLFGAGYRGGVEAALRRYA